MMEVKTAIVTGASGFIGKAVTQLLLSKGTKVYGVYTNPDKVSDLVQNPLFVGIQATFEEYGKIPHAVSGEIDAWFHLSFQGGFAGESLKNYAVQLENTKISCDCVMMAAELKVRKFIYASTVNEIEAIGYLNNGFEKPRYTCIYSAGKVATEIMGKTLASNVDVEFVSALIAMPYGENNYAKNLPNIVMKQLNGGLVPKLIEGNNHYDLIYIGDIAKAFLAIGRNGKNLESYYIGHRKLQTFKELLCQMRDAIAPETQLNFGAFPDAPALDYSLIDLDALYRDTGFECTADFKESIQKTAQWLKSIESKG